MAAGKRELSTRPSLASRVGVQKVRYDAINVTTKYSEPCYYINPHKASQRAPFLRQTLSAPSKTKNSTEKTWDHDLHHVNNPQAVRAGRLRGSPHVQIGKGNRLYESLTTETDLNGPSSLTFDQMAGNNISIRGIAGPYVVVASNFAQGTSDADITSAVSQYGEPLSCKIVSTSPTLTAEIVFADKSNAEQVVNVFNNQLVSSC